MSKSTDAEPTKTESREIELPCDSATHNENNAEPICMLVNRHMFSTKLSTRMMSKKN